MSFYDAFKDALSIAQKTDNIDLYKQLLDLSAQALDLQEENRKLKLKIEELEQSYNLEKEIIRHESTYITLGNDTALIKYCSRCWEVDKKLVQINCKSNGRFNCPNCDNTGVYDEHRVKQYAQKMIQY